MTLLKASIVIAIFAANNLTSNLHLSSHVPGPFFFNNYFERTVWYLLYGIVRRRLLIIYNLGIPILSLIYAPVCEAA